MLNPVTLQHMSFKKEFLILRFSDKQGWTSLIYHALIAVIMSNHSQSVLSDVTVFWVTHQAHNPNLAFDIWVVLGE